MAMDWERTPQIGVGLLRSTRRIPHGILDEWGISMNGDFRWPTMNAMLLSPLVHTLSTK